MGRTKTRSPEPSRPCRHSLLYFCDHVKIGDAFNFNLYIKKNSHWHCLFKKKKIKLKSPFRFSLIHFSITVFFLVSLHDDMKFYRNSKICGLLIKSVSIIEITLCLNKRDWVSHIACLGTQVGGLFFLIWGGTDVQAVVNCKKMTPLSQMFYLIDKKRGSTSCSKSFHFVKLKVKW